MSRPIVRRTYGRGPSLPNSSTAANPFGTPSSPFSFDLATPPSSPPPTRTPKRARTQTHEPSSPLFGQGQPPIKDDVVVSTKEHRDVAQPPPSKRTTTTTTQATLSSFFAPRPRNPLVPIPARANRDSTAGPSGASDTTRAPSAKPKSTSAPHTQAQLRLTHLPLLHTCRECHMSYVRGGEDEGVHEKHHGRVLRGIPWDGLGRRRATASSSTSNGAKNALRRTGSDGVGSSEQGWREVGETRFGKDGKGRARLVECDGSWGGSKLEEILAMVDVALSSPPLPPAIIERCKVYIALTCSPPPPQPGRARPSVGRMRWDKARVVGVVVSQGIKWAMRVLDAEVDMNERGGENESPGEGAAGVEDVDVHANVNVNRPPPALGTLHDSQLRAVDTGDGVMCDPTPLPTPLGIHRLYTIPSYRGTGLARALLDVACAQTIYACPARTERGQVAFSQPTESGARMMRRWGGGKVRVFVDDESQI